MAPVDNVTAYLKLRASIDTRDVFMWFTGRIDLVVPGEPVKPIIDVESLILRRTERLGPLAWTVTDWEAALYRPLGEDRYLEPGEKTRNPHTDVEVTPLHYREGPVRFRFTDREPRIVGSRDILPDTGKPFSYPWRIVNDDLWMTKSSYISIVDACLVPQMYNARRFSCELGDFPTLSSIDAHCRSLDAFRRAEPENQPDAAD